MQRPINADNIELGCLVVTKDVYIYHISRGISLT